MSYFQRHMIEMVLSMVIPMGFFAITLRLLLPLAGVDIQPGFGSLGQVVALIAAVGGMTIPMAVLMRHRGHDWSRIWQMTAAMFAPVLVIMPLIRVVLPGMGVTLSPMIMLPLAFGGMTAGMIVLMAVQRESYSSRQEKARLVP